MLGNRGLESTCIAILIKAVMSAPHSTIAMMLLYLKRLVRASVYCPVRQMWYTIPAVIGKSGIISSAHLDNAKTQKVCEKMVAFLGVSKATVIEAVVK
jgi:hypothetical protein